MTQTVYLNEFRIPLHKLQNLQLFQYRAPGLSAKHKRSIETQISEQLAQIAFFEGNVLFCLPLSLQLDECEIAVKKVLQQRIRDYQEENFKVVHLSKVRESGVERLFFKVFQYIARRRYVFKLVGRTLFRPHRKKGLAFQALETTVKIEDQYLKFHFTPTFVVLENFDATDRANYQDLHLIGLCKHREGCPLADIVGGCKFISPGDIGYFAGSTPFSLSEEDEKQRVAQAFLGCPQIDKTTTIVRVKATLGAESYLLYPSYTLKAKLSREELSERKNVATEYRDATLMDADKRWKYTTDWLDLLLKPITTTDATGQQYLQVEQLAIPVEILFTQPFPMGSPVAVGRPYRAVQIRDQKVIVDQSNPQPKGTRGGSAFLQHGAYDRDDIRRPFDTVSPYFVVPTSEPSLMRDARTFINVLSDEVYTPHSSYDTSFAGLNTTEAQVKYNCHFKNVWKEEEDIYQVSGSLDSYMQAVEEIVLKWTTESDKGGKIAIVVIPDSHSGKENDPFYYSLKKRLVEEGIPSQFLTATTLQGVSDRRISFGYTLGSLWLNMYAKLGGKPWALANELGNVHCFIGIGFGLSSEPIGNHIYAGVAHVFDRFGSWIDLASASKTLSPAEKADFDSPLPFLEGTSSFKISQDTTKEIISNALALYRLRQGSVPKHIVLHKLGPLFECEVIGFLDAVIAERGTLEGCTLGILQLEQDHQARLYGESRTTEDRVVPRRTGLIFNTSKMALSTTGAMSRYDGSWYYPGIGTPLPLLLTQHYPSALTLRKYRLSPSQFYPITTLGEHVIALSQLHWGSTKDNVRLPITTLYAQLVADFLSKTGIKIPASLGYGTPWFL